MAGKASRGSPMISFRIPPALLEQIRVYCRERNVYDREGEYTVTKFLLAAAADKLAHLARSKKPRKRKLAGEKRAEAILDNLFPSAS